LHEAYGEDQVSGSARGIFVGNYFVGCDAERAARKAVGFIAAEIRRLGQSKGRD